MSTKRPMRASRRPRPNILLNTALQSRCFVALEISSGSRNSTCEVVTSEKETPEQVPGHAAEAIVDLVRQILSGASHRESQAYCERRAVLISRKQISKSAQFLRLSGPRTFPGVDSLTYMSMHKGSVSGRCLCVPA